MLGDFQVFVELALLISGIAGAVALGAIWLRSQLVRQRHIELEELAETRGHRIEDLEKRVEAQDKRIAFLEGQIESLMQLKTKDIVDGVIDGLTPELGRA